MAGERILIVEDQNIVANELKMKLEIFGYEVIGIAAHEEKALGLLETNTADLVLMDIKLRRGSNGITLAEKIKKLYNLPIIYLTAYADDDTLKRAKLTEPYGYILKPFIDREVYINIEMALYKHKIQKELLIRDRAITTSLNAVFLADLDGIITFVNPAFLKIWGYTNEKEVIGTSFYQLNNITLIAEQIQTELKESGRWEGECFHSCENGCDCYVHLSIGIVKDKSNTPIQITGSFIDITKRKLMEEQLFNEKEQLDITLSSIGDGVITTDHKGNITFLNSIARKLTGWPLEEVIGKPFTHCFHVINELTREQCENPIDKVLRTGKIVGLANNTVLISKNGEERVIADSGAPIIDKNNSIIGVVVVFRDMTDKRYLENELVKIQKLDSLGILAGGIAHDFNNILVSIIGNLSLAKLVVTADDNRGYNLLLDIEKATIRAMELTQQLLTFSKGGKPLKAVTHIEEIIKDTAIFASRGSKVKCQFNGLSKLKPVEVDAGQISQVINNLIINAIHAMPDGGDLIIKGENIILNPMEVPTLGKGAYIKISIKDSGIGIQPENLNKIFDPFFTTKQIGNGLGLATSYSIINKHNGYLTVESEVGKGTVFHIYIPVTEKIKYNERIDNNKIFYGQGNILVMEDDEYVRKTFYHMITSLGYKCEVTENSEQALALYKKTFQTQNQFDLVILDFTIPGGIGGKKVFELLKKINPEIKAIVTSGYSNNPIMVNFKDGGFSDSLPKPFRLIELSKKIHMILKPLHFK